MGQTGVMIVVFALTLAGFLVHERRAVNPVVNLALFRIRMFVFSVLSLLVFAITSSVLTFLLPFYLQDVLHHSPSFIGLLFLSAPVLTISLAALAGLLTDRIGPMIPASIGLSVIMVGFAIGVVLKVDSHWSLPALLLACTGIGQGFFNTPNQTAIYCVAFSPDDKQVISSSHDQSLKLWNVADGKLVREFRAYKEKVFEKGHQDQVLCVAFSPDGKQIASGSMDRTIKVWNVADGNVVKELANPNFKPAAPGLPLILAFPTQLAWKAFAVLRDDAAPGDMPRWLATALTYLGYPAAWFQQGMNCDYAQGGSMIEWPKTLDAVMKLDIDTVIPNRGNPATKADLQAARSLYEREKNTRFLERNLAETALAYAARNEWREAYDAAARHGALQDQLAEMRRDELSSRLRVEFDTAKKEQENRALVRENALRTAALAAADRERRWQRAAIVLTALLAAALAVLFWRQVVNTIRMRAMAMTDELTRLPNRRNILTVAESAFRDAERSRRPLSVIAFDIDHFKRINDTWGHAAGDEVLKSVARACRRALRPSDHLGRTGGEEFLVVLRDTTAPQAADVAERLRDAVERLDFSAIESALRVTISLGVQARAEQRSVDVLVKQADELLYRAKSDGRNRVASAA